MENPKKPRDTKPLKKVLAEQPDVDKTGDEHKEADLQGSPEPKQDWLGRLSSRRGLALLIGGSTLFLLLAAIAAIYFLVYHPQSMNYRMPLTPPVSLGELVKEYPELASILTDPRLDSVLKDFLMVYQKGGPEAAYDLAKKRGLINKKDEVVLTLELDAADTEALQAELEAHGIKVTTVSGNLMDIAIPLEIIQKSIEAGNPAGLFEDIAGLEHVKRIRVPIPFGGTGRLYSPSKNPRQAGNVGTESLSVIGASDWQDAGFTGEGVKVGVIDCGDFGGYTELLGTELPESVTARSFISGVGLEEEGDVHGTACAEIIHDVAPDAELYFAAFHTEAELSQAIDWMLSQGVQIISFSVGRSLGPFDGTSSQSRLVDSVVEKGVLWVNAAGNEGDKHYRGTFTDTDGNGYHEFDTNKELLEFQVPEGQDRIILNWDDWQNGTQDYNLYIYDSNDNLIVSAEDIQNGPGSDAAEGVIYNFPAQDYYYAAFYAANATRPVTFDFFVDGWVEPNYTVPEYSLSVPADARRNLSVGAVNWENDALEEYSSWGPTADGRLKPELVAPSMVSSAAYGQPWPGTSASAPHVAGAAALILQAFPDYSPEQITEFLESRAVDLGDNGPDNTYGYGRLWLGDPPGSSAAPEPTEAAMLPPEETATHPVSENATPTRRHTATPSSSSDSSDTNLSLGLLICVAAPALAGLGGIGLLGMVLYKRRSQPAVYSPGGYSISPHAYPRTPPAPPVYTPTPLPQQNVGRKIEGVNVCPRCGMSHRPQARFCPVCGFTLKPAAQFAGKVLYCTYCGNPLVPSSRFCTKCGKPRRIQ